MLYFLRLRGVTRNDPGRTQSGLVAAWGGGHNRKQNARGTVVIMVNRVDRRDPAPVVIKGFACVRVDIETREIAAGNVDPDAVPLLEDVGGRIKLDREGIDRAWRHQLFLLERVAKPGAHNTVFEVEVEAAG